MQYRVTVLNPVSGQQSEESWQAVEGEGRVHTEQKIRQHFQGQGGVVLRITPVRSWFQPKQNRQVALGFCQEMKVLLESGLNVVEAVETLALRSDRSVLSRVYAQLQEVLRGGSSLSVGLQAFPALFPGFFVASVQASEHSGNLVAALNRFIAYREKLDDLRNRLVSAALYPAIVLGVSALVILFLVGYVIPRFSVVFSDMVDRLPLLTRWLLSVGLSLSNHAQWWALGALAVSVVGVWAVRLPTVRQLGLAWLGRRAIIKNNVVQYARARLYRTVAMLVESGIPFVSALQMSRAVLSEGLVPACTLAIADIENGQSIAHTFTKHDLVDSITGRILLAGERSGDVAGALNNMARFVEQNLTGRIDRLARVLEPVIMLGVGSLIGLIVVLMYSPIFELANAIQ